MLYFPEIIAPTFYRLIFSCFFTFFFLNLELVIVAAI